MKRAVLLWGIFWSTAVWADTGAVDYALTQAQPTSLIGIQVEGARFVLPQGSGRYLTATLRADYAPVSWMSIGARVPLNVLALDGEATRVGLGDVGGVLKFMLGHFDGGAISIGLYGEFPTGNGALGLGSGQIELSPFIRANFLADIFTVQLNVADSISVGIGQPAFPEFIHPRSNHELQYQLGMGFFLFRQLTLMAVGEGVTVWDQPNFGETLIVVGPQIRWLIADHYQLIGTGHFPVYGPHRAEWQATAAFQYLF